MKLPHELEAKLQKLNEFSIDADLAKIKREAEAEADEVEAEVKEKK